jgi:hypothetical protein
VAALLGDSRRHALQTTEVRQAPGARPDAAERWEVLVSHRAERGREVAYRVTVARTAPSAALMSCADDLPKAEARYAAISFSRVEP